MPRKRILLKCYEPIGLGPQYEQPWADVYLIYKDRWRRRVRLGPTLHSRTDIIDSLAAYREGLGEPGLRPVTTAHLHRYIAESEAILSRLDREPVVVEDPSEDGAAERAAQGIPNVYSAAPMLTRAVAERMLRHLLTAQGLGPMKFAWLRPSFVVTPV